MSYAVHVPDPVRRKIDGWELSAYLRYELYRRLDEVLAASPTQQLVRVYGTTDTLQYSFVTHDETDPALRDHLFVFTVRYGMDEETLVICDCEHLAAEEEADD
jgi:hypothetical protein